jgi:hypothetical protein
MDQDFADLVFGIGIGIFAFVGALWMLRAR